MLTFSRKYFFQKCFTGAVLILLGCSNKLFSAMGNKLLYLFLALYAVGMLWSVLIKAESEDERASENKFKAKSCTSHGLIRH